MSTIQAVAVRVDQIVVRSNIRVYRHRLRKTVHSLTRFSNSVEIFISIAILLRNLYFGQARWLQITWLSVAHVTFHENMVGEL